MLGPRCLQTNTNSLDKMRAHTVCRPVLSKAGVRNTQPTSLAVGATAAGQGEDQGHDLQLSLRTRGCVPAPNFIVSWCRSAQVPAVRRPARTDARTPSSLPACAIDGVAEAHSFMIDVLGPNVEVTGPRRHGALAARRNMDSERCAARVPCRSGSG
jgi:hypothetical protein